MIRAYGLLFVSLIDCLQAMTYISSNGERSSSETAYLTPEVLARPNLRVVTGAHVTRIVLKDVNGKKRVTAVVYANSSSKSHRRRVRVRKEAIVSYVAVIINR